MLKHLASSVLFLTLGLATGPAALFAQCGDNEPAFPVPECRSAATGAEVSCTQPNAARLWPDGFRPGLPDQQLPADRDSTQWRSFTIPGFSSGHELFHSLDVVGDRLLVVYNAGLQVWGLGGGNADDPQRLEIADGWRGDFFQFPSAGENDFFVYDVAGIDPSGGNQDLLIAVAGEDGVGTSIWEYTRTPSDLNQLYQDLGTGTGQVRVVELGGTVYAFAAAGSTDGVYVYNMTAAQNLASPCLDDRGSVCPGVFLGKLGTTSRAFFLDVVVENDKVYVAVGRNVSQDTEIWELANPSNPATAVRRFSGVPSVQGISLFEWGGEHYLGAVERRPGLIWEVRIYRASDCLTGSGSCSVQSIPWSYRPAQVGQDRFLTFSTSNGTPYLYYGVQSNDLSGSAIEGLFNLTDLGGGNQIFEITESGESYTDECSGNTVDYWGDYYENNGHGLRNIRPRVGMFRGDYFYRAAFGILDVHEITVATPALVVSGPTEGCPGEAASFQVTANNCSPDPPTSPYAWTASGGGQISGDGTASVDITWSTPGIKTVQVTNPDCADAVGTATINIQDTGSLGFTSGPTYDGAPGPRGLGDSVQFTVGTTGASQWEWDFGDGTPVQTFDSRAAGENPSHTFNQLGTFTVTVTIRNCAGGEDSREVSIEIINNPLEILVFRARCLLGICDFCVGESVIFDQEFAGNPAIYRYDWDGNGGPPWDQSSASPVTTHAYNTPQLSFFPKIRIENGAQSAELTHARPISVVDCSPPASITVFGPSTRTVNVPGSYSASAANCSPAANGWTWTASGGVISGNTSSSAVTIVWGTPGTYTVTARNSACGTAVGNRTVVVSQSTEELNADFSFSPPSPEAGQQVTFDGRLSTGNIGSWDWSFGDGTTANGSIVTHTFATGGTYMVTLTVLEVGCGNPGCTDQLTRAVEVTGTTQELSADFSFSPEDPEAGQEVAFDGTLSTGDVESYDWDFGDGNSAEGATVDHVFTAGGTYAVTLTVTEAGSGATAELTRDVEVADGEPTEMLILPYFAVDTYDPTNLTTFLGVRNGSDIAVTVQQAYFAADQDETPFAVETYSLDPHRIRSVDLSTIFGLPTDELGLAEGWALITVTEPLLGQPVLGGDFFRLERNSDFASGNSLITAAVPDLCSSWQMRFFNGGNFDGGTAFTFYAPGNPGDGEPIATGLVYDEPGNFVREITLLNTEVVFELTSQDLGLGTEFGGIEWRFRDGVVGHVAGILKASGRYSVGLPAVCQDGSQ